MEKLLKPSENSSWWRQSTKRFLLLLLWYCLPTSLFLRVLKMVRYILQDQNQTRPYPTTLSEQGAVSFLLSDRHSHWSLRKEYYPSYPLPFTWTRTLKSYFFVYCSNCKLHEWEWRKIAFLWMKLFSYVIIRHAFRKKISCWSDDARGDTTD